MPGAMGEEDVHASISKRPRETSESNQPPPLKRPKTDDQGPTTAPTESTISYDACPMPRVVDYFYEDLVPKASELAQLFPALYHNAYLVRRWLGSAGCAVYWTMVMEDVNKTDVPNPSHPLAGLIARSLAKLRGPEKGASSPKLHALLETLRSHLGLDDVRKVVIFSECQQLELLPEANSG